MNYEKHWYNKEHKHSIKPQPTLKVGRWDVGYIYYDFTSLAPRGRRHVAVCQLPGMHREQGHYSTEREAKEALDKVFNYWLYYLCFGEQEQKAQVRRVTRSREVEEETPALRVRRSRPVETPVARLRRAPRV